MRSIHTDPELTHLEQRVLHYAQKYKRNLPEMRFFILDPMEFASLLIKKVYPVSPINLWEGKDMINTRNRIESGQESSLYYEVVQCGRPSYAYLNETNNAMTQASVMAHVVGHCEFSEINVMQDSDDDRTEWIIFLTNKVNRARYQMGDNRYKTYWNACESLIPLIHPNSRFNLQRALVTERLVAPVKKVSDENELTFLDSIPFSSTIDSMLKPEKLSSKLMLHKAQKNIDERETISRKGFRLKAPCQDITGFLRSYAPSSQAEKDVLNYLYTVNSKQDFVMRTQIMNEGWAMYWEKKIMMKLFKEKACKGIIEYCRVFANVCAPRPWFQRNPYHLGFHMWAHIEEDYNRGHHTADFKNEVDLNKKRTWHQPPEAPAIEYLESIVKTCTDYEFLRRYLTLPLIDKLHLNRLPRGLAKQIGINNDDIVKENQHYVWINPTDVKKDMLNFFTHFYRPRIYLVDTDFMDGGLLLYLRDDGRDLRKDWIKPTLKNINLIWRASISLLTKDKLYTWRAGIFNELNAAQPSFEVVCERLANNERVFTAEKTKNAP